MEDLQAQDQLIVHLHAEEEEVNSLVRTWCIEHFKKM